MYNSFVQLYVTNKHQIHIQQHLLRTADIVQKHTT